MQEFIFKIIIQAEESGEGFYAYVPALPGCISCGDTLEETRANLHEAIEGVLASMRAHGDPIPGADVLVEEMKVAA